MLFRIRPNEKISKLSPVRNRKGIGSRGQCIVRLLEPGEQIHVRDKKDRLELDGYLTVTHCCNADKRKTRGTQKKLIEKHIYSSNRNKIQVNLVKQ